MTTFRRLFLFGDVTWDFVSSLEPLLQISDNPLLLSFLQRTAYAIRVEVGRLPEIDRRGLQVPSFTSFADLLAVVKASRPAHPALEKALTCTNHFAQFLRHHEKLGGIWPISDTSDVAGLCTGLLTAVGISCSTSLTDLVEFAVHTVLTAFRTGICVSAVGDRLCGADDKKKSWSILITGPREVACQELIARYTQSQSISIASAPYISAVSPSALTVSGPPGTLRSFIDLHLPQRTLPLPVFGPFHAPHLFDESDIDRILGPLTGTSVACRISGRSPVMGSAKQDLSSSSYLDLLRQALSQILLKPLLVNVIVEDMGTLHSDASSYIIHPIACSAAQALGSALRAHGMTSQAETDYCAVESTESLFENDSLPSGDLSRSKLAIVGLSGRFPGADTLQEFWSLLREGRDMAREAPKERWDVETHVDPTLKRKNTSGTPYGCWLEHPGLFDANFFHMSPREAPQTDPAQRLALMTAYEAMENAGMVPDATPSTRTDRVGVFYGTTSNDWGETNSSQDIDTYYIPGSCRAFIPGRQNYFFKLSGPSYSVDTACSSSLAALHLACNSLWRGDIDTAIVGGTNVTTNPDITAGLDRGHFLSKTGNCKTFDDEADGYCRGEGIVSLIVKRLEDAIEDNDPVLAVILGTYTNHSAMAESITRPHVGAQKAIFEKILTSAAVAPSSIDYIEMHGTGTQAGDAREMDSVLSVFGQDDRREDPLFLGSVKANVGHGESVSGVVALSKVLLMFSKNEIPPHIGIKTKINTKFPKNLNDRNIFIATKPTAWPRPKTRRRRAMINNFSAAGGNSSILIEDRPKQTKSSSQDLRRSHIVTVSARSATALQRNLQHLIEFLKTEQPNLADLAYTTTSRRTQHRYRAIAVGHSLEAVTSQLEKKASTSISSIRPSNPTPIAFAFTGQGSQYPGMAQGLMLFDVFRDALESLNTVGVRQGFPSILSFVRNEVQDDAAHSSTTIQLAIVCVQIAMTKLWKSWNVKPYLVIGHSLGEYAALNASGVLSDVDTIYLVGSRASLLEERCNSYTHSMLAVGGSTTQLAQFTSTVAVEVACINGPNETVLSGPNDAVDRAFAFVRTEGLKASKLDVPFAFHSSQVDPILIEFENIARNVTFRSPEIPVLSTVTGTIVREAGVFNATYLKRHCREPVNFIGALTDATLNCLKPRTIWLELGSHPVVSGLLRHNIPTATTLATLQRNKDQLHTSSLALSSLYEAGNDINWHEYHRQFTPSLAVIDLPSYSWDLRNYWMQYVNDWSLYKGDAAFLSAKDATKLSTTCVQEVIEETLQGDKLIVLGQSDLLREDLDPFVRGHRVNGVALCTPSVYAEMALVLGEYLRKQRNKWTSCLVDVQHMDVQKPLAVVSKGKGPQYLRCQLMIEVATDQGHAEFYSVTSEGKKLTKHAECRIGLLNTTNELKKVQELGPSIRASMDDMRTRLMTHDDVQKLRGSSGYQLVSSLASYDAEYQGVQEVILDSGNLEAAAKIYCDPKIRPPATKGRFCVDPYLIDNFGQPALFIMNANDKADLSKEVFVNHGWTSLQFYRPVSVEKRYCSHVKMTGSLSDGMYSGDMTVFEGDEIVASFKGIKAQGVPRRLMDYIVKMRDDTRQETHPAASGPSAPFSSTAASKVVTKIQSNPELAVRPSAAEDTWKQALLIVSEESGVPMADLTDDKRFADLGIDSLLSLLCASRYREELNLNYPSSIFEENETIGDLKRFWVRATQAKISTTTNGNDRMLDSMFHNIAESSSTSSDPADITDLSSVSTSSGDANPRLAKPSAQSLLLQGNPKSATVIKTLFLLPDGSGSAYSYQPIPEIDASLALVALNCPYMKRPDMYTQDIDHVAELYLAEIRRRQSDGPYALGGWSVGGIFAYRCAQMLTEQDSIVSDLVLIDCPIPRGLDHLPTRYFEYCDRIGLLGATDGGTGQRRAPPSWLIPHFEACINSLHNYYATAFVPMTSAPMTHIIWASDAIDANESIKFDRSEDDPEGLRFLVEERRDFGPCGWESLLPSDRIELYRVKDCNHFSMMKGEGVAKLAEIIRRALMIP